MQYRAALPCLILAALSLAACRDNVDVPRTTTVAADRANDTTVLGGHGSGAARDATTVPLVDARGRAIPRPPIPGGTPAQAVRAGDDTALAVWVQDDQVVASTHASGKGWSPAQPLETIFGQASDPQLASNGRGIAMAVWRHTVGSIQSLRFSRFEAGAGWTHPDVMPGALPRPDAQGDGGNATAPRLEMDTAGNVVARWPSGFAADEDQVARYVDGKGWMRAENAPVAAAPQLPAPAAR